MRRDIAGDVSDVMLNISGYALTLRVLRVLRRRCSLFWSL